MQIFRSGLLFLFFTIVLHSNVLADTLDKNVVPPASIKQFFSRGDFSGRLRSYSMMTVNVGHYPDYYSLAYGLKLAYQTPSWKGLYAGISGSVSGSFVSSALSDSTNGTNSRYESALFDLENPSRRNNITRLETMYLGYKTKRTNTIIGQQEINTPLINTQDSRLSPTLVSGVWMEVKPNKNLELYAGLINKFSPRSITNWYSVDESIMYSPGIDDSGKKAGYIGNLDAAGLAITGAKYKRNYLQIQAWNYFVENIFNTFYGRSEINFPLKNNKLHILLGAEMLSQNRLGNGGNEDHKKAYMQSSKNALAYGTMAGIKKGKSTLSVHYLRIMSNNKFLMPREWGKENFYVTLPRERLEGSGNVHASNIKLEFEDSNSRIKIETAYGIYLLPDAKDFMRNKYGLPSYDQFYFSITKQGKGFLKNMDARLIYTYKGSKGNTYNEMKYILNKSNMHHADIIFNFNF